MKLLIKRPHYILRKEIAQNKFSLKVHYSLRSINTLKLIWKTFHTICSVLKVIHLLYSLYIETVTNNNITTPTDTSIPDKPAYAKEVDDLGLKIEEQGKEIDRLGAKIDENSDDLEKSIGMYDTWFVKLSREYGSDFFIQWNLSRADNIGAKICCPLYRDSL